MIEPLETTRPIDWWNEHRRYTNKFIEKYNKVVECIELSSLELKRFKLRANQAEWQKEIVDVLKQALSDMLSIAEKAEQEVDRILND